MARKRLRTAAHKLAQISPSAMRIRGVEPRPRGTTWITGKGKREKELVPLPALVVEAIRRYLRWRRGTKSRGPVPVSPSLTHGPLNAVVAEGLFAEGLAFHAATVT